MKVIGIEKGAKPKRCEFHLWDALRCDNPAYKTITAPDSKYVYLESHSFCDQHFEQMKAMMDKQ